MPNKIPWNKVKALMLDLSGQLWNEEEKKMREIIDELEKEESEDRVLSVSFSHTIDFAPDLPSIKTKISFSKKFRATKTGSVDDPDQMELGDQAETKDKNAPAKT